MKYVNLKPQMGSNKSTKNSKNSHVFTVLVIVAVLITAAVYMFINKGEDNPFNPISVVSRAAGTDIKQTDGRTNVLILGSDRRSTGYIQSDLTDTLIVASVGKVEGDVVLISLPRDLWVGSPKGFYNKINAVYTLGNQYNPPSGAEDLQMVIEEVLGIPIHYYAVVNFDIFQDTIKTLDGIEVNVETAFEDYEYPVEGKENDTCGRSEEEIKEMVESEQPQPYTVIFPCRYEHLRFEKGLQTMNGETALKYARSRHGNNGEGTDFARAKRQQQVILAVKNKALSLGTLTNPVKLKELYETYKENVDTNITLNDVQGFYQLSQQASFDNIRSIVLDDGNSAEVGGLLYAPTDRSLYGEQYVLIPRAGDFSQVHAYVQRYLFGVN